MWDQKRTGESGETGVWERNLVDGGESGRNISNDFNPLPLSPVSPVFCSTQLLGEVSSDNHPGNATIGPSFDESQTIYDFIFVLADKPSEFVSVDLSTLHDR